MRVAVVGGGITGLVLARRLVAAGIPATILEASSRLGGQIHTVEFEGRPVDVGAEAMHLGAPTVRQLVEELGLTDRIVPANEGSSWLLTPKGLRPLPAGVGPTGPTRIRPVLESRIMSLPGLLRAGQEPLRARRVADPSTLSVGAFIRSRFGDEVADLFVDPLLGNLHSGDIDRLSLVAAAPQLLGKAREGTSLMPPLRRKAAPAGMPVSMFSSFATGLHELVDALAECAEVALDTPVTAIQPEGDGWLVQSARGPERYDAVVLACPAAVAAGLLAPHRSGAAEKLGEGRTADVATVVLGLDRHQPCELLEQANGLLLPSTSGRLTKAMTNLSRKWPHDDHPDLHIVRASVGRAGQDRLAGMDDDQLVAEVCRDLAEVAGVPRTPAASLVVRWNSGMPQLEVGHPERLRAVRAQLAGLPPIVLAGAPFDGLGIGSTVKSANTRADELVATLTRKKDA